MIIVRAFMMVFNRNTIVLEHVSILSDAYNRSATLDFDSRLLFIQPLDL